MTNELVFISDKQRLICQIFANFSPLGSIIRKLTTSKNAKKSKKLLEYAGWRMTETDAKAVMMLYRHVTDSAATKYLHSDSIIYCIKTLDFHLDC